MFSQRPPSATWEPAPLTPDGTRLAWLWFKPPHAPQGVAVHLPPEVFVPVVDAHQQTALLGPSVRLLAGIAGLSPQMLHSWSCFGQTFEASGGVNPLLDAPLPAPPAGVDPQLILWASVAPAAQLPMGVATDSFGTQPAAIGEPIPEFGDQHLGPQFAASAAPDLQFVRRSFTASAPSTEKSPWVAAIEESWRAILQLESQLRTVRNSIEQQAGRISALNRDLGPDERRFADNVDKKDWQDARRWLRDSAIGLQRSSKEIDLGTVSAAGRRNWFEEIYDKFIAKQQSFDGIEGVSAEFEQHHKTLMHVLTAAQNALNKAARDGEQRANKTLQRVATKIRAAQAKRG